MADRVMRHGLRHAALHRILQRAAWPGQEMPGIGTGVLVRSGWQAELGR